MANIGDVIRSGIRGEDLSDLSPQMQRALEPLLRFVNTGIQGLAQALSRNISLSDNMQTEVQTVNLDHGVAQLVSLKKLAKAKGVRSLSVGSADGKTQHALAQPLHLIGTTVTNQVKVLALFQDTTAVRVPVTLELTPEGSYTSLAPSSGVWTAPTLLNAWAVFGGGNMAPGFLKDSLGFVHLRGMISGGGITLPAFVLPAALRPSASVNFASASNGAFGYTFIASNGNVTPQAGSNVWFSLDGITFDTRA